MKKEYPIDERIQIPVNQTTLDLRIRGTKRHNPILLFLHGGPGMCDRHLVMQNQARLTDAFTLVCFDQRGSGKSYRYARNMNDVFLDTLVSDARVVTEYALDRFHQERLVIVGHSWGTFLGTTLCERYPSHIAGYVGVGQLANAAQSEIISYEFVCREAKRRDDKKAISTLTRIGAPVNGMYASVADLRIQRDYLSRYGGTVYGKHESILQSTVLPMLRSGEYSALDVPAYAKGAMNNLERFIREVAACDFISSVRSLDMPVLITQGQYDYCTAAEPAKRWLDALDAPKKDWVDFEHSAHSPLHEEPERWAEVVRNVVLSW